MKYKKIILYVPLILIFSFFLYAERLDIDQQKAFNSIKPQDVYDYCKMLSSVPFAGRFTGDEGFTASAKWVANKFKEWGLKPINKKEGYLQAYPCPYTIIDKADMALLLKEPKEKKSDNQKEISFKETTLEVEKDFLPFLFSDSGSNTAELLCVGWGISAPELGYDDYAGLDVKGKFILCFQGTPDPKDERYRKHDSRSRVSLAKEKGAVGFFYVYAAEPIGHPSGDWIKDFSPIIISEKVADMILKEKRITSSEYKKDLQTYKRPISFPLDSKIRYRVESRHFPNGVGYNVVGYVEGSDSRLKRECLVMGGHFDACGKHMGLLFPGANDNASGSAVVMEIAEAFSKLKEKPKRSAVFILFSGEEMGLLGSKFFVNHVPSQFEKVDTMFNFDMVGEGDGVKCTHSSKPEELKKVLEGSDKSVKILRETSIMESGRGGSDHAPFRDKGVPCLYFVSNGPHLNYHRTNDMIFRINPDIMADIARLAFLSGFIWANR